MTVVVSSMNSPLAADFFMSHFSSPLAQVGEEVGKHLGGVLFSFSA